MELIILELRRHKEYLAPCNAFHSYVSIQTKNSSLKFGIKISGNFYSGEYFEDYLLVLNVQNMGLDFLII